MTLCYSIKYENICFLKYIFQKVSLIFQVQATKDPKYLKALLKQIYIIGTKFANPILQKAYSANILINL